MPAGAVGKRTAFSVLRDTAAFCASLLHHRGKDAREALQCEYCHAVAQVVCFAPEGAGPGELEAVCLACGQRWVARRDGRGLVLVAPITPYDE